MKRYAQLAATLGERIEQGLYRPGDRLPSVRALSEEHGVSISTVQQAYRVLEDDGLVEPRPKSGYFVPERRELPPMPAMTRPAQRPVDVSQWDQVLEQVRRAPGGDFVQLGRGTPDIASPSLKPLQRAMVHAARRTDLQSLGYEGIQGSLPLREQIARLMLDSGCQVPPSEIVITTGCQEALAITLRAICEPGDIIAIDSPSFHGAMQALKAYGLKALEIPTDPTNGISLEALELAMEQWPVKLILLTPNCNNPLGYIMPDARKRALLTLAARYDVPILEDDVYGELAYASRAHAASSPSTPTTASCWPAPSPRRSRPACAPAGWYRGATWIASCTSSTSPVAPARRSRRWPWPSSSAAATTSRTSAACARSTSATAT